MSEPKPEPSVCCGVAPVIHRPFPWEVYCSECVDGATDRPHLVSAHDLHSKDAAIRRWNELMAEMRADLEARTSSAASSDAP